MGYQKKSTYTYSDYHNVIFKFVTQFDANCTKKKQMEKYIYTMKTEKERLLVNSKIGFTNPTLSSLNVALEDIVIINISLYKVMVRSS